MSHSVVCLRFSKKVCRNSFTCCHIFLAWKGLLLSQDYTHFCPAEARFVRADSHGQPNMISQGGGLIGPPVTLKSQGSASSEQARAADVLHNIQSKPIDTVREPTANSVGRNLKPLGRKPGYEPDLQAIEDAKRCSKFANTSLNFSDVDNAINYLNDALKLLTGYGDNEIVVRVED